MRDGVLLVLQVSASGNSKLSDFLWKIIQSDSRIFFEVLLGWFLSDQWTDVPERRTPCLLLELLQC